MNGRIVGSKPLYVALAQRKEDRKNHLASQYMQRLTTTRMQNAQLNQVYGNAAGPAAMYLPTMQNPAGRYYPAGSFAAPNRTTPRWPAQQRAQLPANTFHNYQMVNAGQPRGRAPYNPAAANQMIRANNNGMRMPYNTLNPMRVQQQPMNGVLPGQQQIPRGPQQQQPGQKFNRAPQGMNPQVPNPQAINVPGQEPLTTGMLAAAQPQEQKQMLGERLYPLIHSMHPEWAGKITGMLLEIDNAELLHMLDSRESLKAKVDEAVVVLQAHQAKQAVAQRQAEQ